MTHILRIACFSCGAKYPAETIIFECAVCKGPLDIIYNYEEIKKHILGDEFKSSRITHWKYWPFYPIHDLSRIVTLHEGGTPLIPSQKKGYYFKNEGLNPTGSFKDRGTTIEMSHVVEIGATDIACATTGNMGASIAAYAARAKDVKATFYIPTFASKIKYVQIKAYGGTIVLVKGTYEDALNRTKELRKKKGTYLTGDYPYRGEGEKSVGFEIIDQLGWRAPDAIVCPIGNGTLIYGVYKAMLELSIVGLLDRMPKIIAVQAQGCSPIVKAFREKKKTFTAVKSPKTIASAINCGNPVDGVKALHALYDTHGTAVSVTDKEIRAAQKLLGREGIYAEPGGAAAYAGALKLGLKGQVVILVTGHGLKDPFV
ncbi:threonine synthase [Candidatus Woesearchaeota archaeon]|nr:threonine synthase [Candidatus Woesearchaeota archaeon]